MKGIQIGKEEIKLFGDDTENSKESTNKLSRLINGFSKIVEYKINI